MYLTHRTLNVALVGSLYIVSLSQFYKGYRIVRGRQMKLVVDRMTMEESEDRIRQKFGWG